MPRMWELGEPWKAPTVVISFYIRSNQSAEAKGDAKGYHIKLGGSRVWTLSNFLLCPTAEGHEKPGCRKEGYPRIGLGSKAW